MVGVETGVGEFDGTQSAHMDDFATLEDAFVVVDETSRMNTPPPSPVNSFPPRNISVMTTEQKILLQLAKSKISFESLRSTERWFLFKFGPFLVRRRRNIMALCTAIVVLCAAMASQLQPSKDIPHLFPSDHVIQMHWQFSANNFTDGRCDECGAAFQSDFLCHNVICGGGNVCIHGECHDPVGNKLTLATTPCTASTTELQSECAVELSNEAARTSISAAVNGGQSQPQLL
jgi:hypothetical protein